MQTAAEALGCQASPRLLGSFAIQLACLATPLFTQVIIDKVVVNRGQAMVYERKENRGLSPIILACLLLCDTTANEHQKPDWLKRSAA